MGVFARQLDRALVGLSAGVAQERATAEARLAEPLGQLHRRLRVEEIRGVHEPPRLLAEGLDHLGMAVAQGVDRDPGQEVEIALSLVVPEVGPLAAYEVDRARR